MYRLPTMLLMVFFPLAMMAQNQHLHFAQNGEFASVSQSTSPTTSFNLQVSRNSSSGSATTANISYEENDTTNPNFESFVVITGAIPASAFTGQNTQHLVLKFDTSQLDPNNSFSESCILDLNTFNTTCGPAPQGTIEVEFHENDMQRTRVLAFDEETIFGPVTTHIHQRSDNSTADFKGAVFGVPVSGTNANVGVNHSSTLEVTHN